MSQPPEALALLSLGQVNETDQVQEYDGPKPSYQRAFLSLKPFYSESQSFLGIRRLAEELPCNQAHQLQVDYILAREALGTELQSVDIVCLDAALSKSFPCLTGPHGLASLACAGSPINGSSVTPLQIMAKGTVATVLRKELHLPVEAGLRGSFSLELPVGLQLAPTAKVLCYAVLPNGEMVADSTKLHVGKCFPNKVKLDFSEKRALAGSKLHLKVQAALGSLCVVHAMHQSMQSLSPKTRLTSSTRAALKIVTNTKIRKPCTKHSPLRSHRSLAIPPNPQGSPGAHPGACGHVLAPSPEQDPDPQRNFPETWLWDLVPVGKGGSTEVPVTVPDAITKWKAKMFCTAGPGFGLSPTITLMAFKPFFVELALPYTIIHNEAFTLKATVFNYLQQCLRVRVTLAESAQLELLASAEGTYSSCVCVDEGRTFQWGVRATSLGEVNVTVSTEALHSEELCGNEDPLVPIQGHVDTMIKPLLVQPEGILEEKAYSSLLCQEGDILGNALQNLDHLLAMPYGCGEQNMVRFTPNIYIQHYLEKSGQLRPDIQAKAQGFLQSGYKHDDDSYSAFEKTDPKGKTWVTAFVLKSFGQARAYIAITEQHTGNALRWLQKQQWNTGCFQSVGKLFNNTLQGSVSDALSLSAYVMAALLELGLPPMDTVVALQALAKYATLTYSGNRELVVTVRSTTGAAQEFLLENSNQLVLQQAALHKLPGQYAAQAHGQGCALLQVTALQRASRSEHRHLESTRGDGAQGEHQGRQRPLQPRPLGTVCSRAAFPKPLCPLWQVTGRLGAPSSGREAGAAGGCMVPAGREGRKANPNPDPSMGLCPCRYTGERPATNMAVIEAKLPSSYIPDKGSMTELTKEEETFAFSMRQDFPARNLQPATMRLYDCCKIGDRMNAAYYAPCGSGRGQTGQGRGASLTIGTPRQGYAIPKGATQAVLTLWSPEEEGSEQ
nr:PREDICTED: murinoglobulin-1-like [Struthio camelus australis]